MKIGGTDKLLIGIVIGVIVLIAVAFAVVLLQPKPTYKSDDTAEGTLYNYLFAVTQEDWVRAYPYLSNTLPGYPKTQSEFNRQVARGRDTSSMTWQVGSARAVGAETNVTVTITRFYSNSLFGSNQSQSTEEFTLQQQEGAWRIIRSSSYNFWNHCWEQARGCN